MGLTHFVVHQPRYFLKSTTLRSLWNSGILNSYSSINKLGIDEDTTTLAVNAILDLRESIGTSLKFLHVCTTANDFDRAVFLEATGLSPENVKFYPYGESSALLAVVAAAKIQSHGFLLVDAPVGKDETTDAFCSALAIAGYCGEAPSVQIVTEKQLSPLLSNESRLDSHTFSSSMETELISLVSKASEGWNTPVVFANIADLRSLSRRVKSAYVEGQKLMGFTGITSGLSSLIYWLKNQFTPDFPLVLIASDEGGGLAIEFHPKDRPTILTNNPTIELDGSSYMMRKRFSHGNVSVPQGAYISTPVYFAQKGARYRLLTAKCTNCASILFPPRAICKECGKKTAPSDPLPRSGNLFTFTQILKGAAPSEFDLQQRLEGEYCVGIIKFENGPKVISQLTDVAISELNIGDKMKMVFRKIYHQDGTDRYGYKFTRAV